MCALLLADVQGIRHMNGAFSRETNGILLKQIAARLEKYARDSDIAVRIGEDVFAVMITRIQNCDEARSVARRICAALLKPYVIKRAKNSIWI